MPAIFITPFLSYDAEIGTKFHEQFAFDTLQFTDRVVHHRDKARLYESQLTFICNEWLHGVMVGAPGTVVLPWRAQADELTFLAAEAQEAISNSLGWKVPSPRIVGAAR